MTTFGLSRQRQDFTSSPRCDPAANRPLTRILNRLLQPDV